MFNIRLSQIVSPFLSNPLEHDVQYFTQFNIHTTECINPQFTEHYCVDTREAKIGIFSAKFITTPEGTSAEGQHLTGKKLTLIGSTYVTLLLTHRHIPNKHQILKFPIPFSTFIVVPQSICDMTNIPLGYLIEDLSIIRLSQGKIFISVTLLIQYQDFI